MYIESMLMRVNSLQGCNLEELYRTWGMFVVLRKYHTCGDDSLIYLSCGRTSIYAVSQKCCRFHTHVRSSNALLIFTFVRGAILQKRIYQVMRKTEFLSAEKIFLRVRDQCKIRESFMVM